MELIKKSTNRGRNNRDMANQECERSQALSYSFLAGEIDEEEERLFEMTRNHPQNTEEDNLNQPIFNFNDNRSERFTNSQISETSQFLNRSNPIKFGQFNTLFSDYEAMKLSKKTLGKKITSSIVKPGEDFIISQVSEQSQIIHNNDSLDQESHFIVASIDSSNQQISPQFQQTKIQCQNYIIKITQSKKMPKFTMRAPVLSDHYQHEKISSNPAIMNSQNRLTKQSLNMVSDSLRLPNNYLSVTNDVNASIKAINGSYAKPFDNKMIQSKIISRSPPAKDEQPKIQISNNNSKEITNQRECFIEVPNRMKSTYDPRNVSQYKAISSGGNLSEPDQHNHKKESGKKQKNKDLFSGSVTSEQKAIGLQIMKQTLANKLQTLEKAINNLQDNSDNDDHLRQKQQKKNHKSEERDNNVIKIQKQKMEKIQSMRNLASQSIFDGFSSINSNSQLNNTICNKKQNYFLMQQQIKQLRNKIDKLQLKLHQICKQKPDHHQFNIKHSEKSQSKNRNRNHNKHQVHFHDPLIQGDFRKIQDLLANFKFVLSDQYPIEEMVKLAVQIFQYFQVKLTDCHAMDLLKFQDCVQFCIAGSNNALIWYYSGKIYLGQCHTKMNQQMIEPHGRGIQIIPNTYIYKGSFKHNKKCGFGMMSSNKTKYIGEWSCDLYEGKGKLLTQQSYFKGYFDKGRRSGQGVQHFNNGDVYTGEYCFDKFHRRGKYVWNNTTCYVGQFINGFMEGQGVWTEANGDCYEGQYYRNKKHGVGNYTCKNGDSFQCLFEKGALKKQKIHKRMIQIEKQINFQNLDSQYSESISKSRSRSRSRSINSSESNHIKTFTIKKIGNEISSKNGLKKVTSKIKF